MSKNAMAGAVTLCGVGLCVIGAALMMQNGNSAHAGSMMAAAVAVTAVTHAQAGPTIVWYQAVNVNSAETSQSEARTVLFRAWSDGTVEARQIWDRHVGVACLDGLSPFYAIGYCDDWHVVSSPTEGFRAAADSNADEKVDGIDLASILSNWGDAPRVPFPPSDCPLNLINP